MWFTRRGPSATSGFSLTEALVALAIAAFLAAVLTRFVSSTRANALRVRQEVAMDILSDSLLERLNSRDLQPGRTDGRSGTLRWHIDIAPMTFSAHALSVSQKKPINSSTPANGPGFAPSIGANGLGAATSTGAAGSVSTPGWAVGLLSALASTQTTAATAATATTDASATSKPRVLWIAYHVTAVITSHSDLSHAVDTIRLAGQGPKGSPDQTAKQ